MFFTDHYRIALMSGRHLRRAVEDFIKNFGLNKEKSYSKRDWDGFCLYGNNGELFEFTLKSLGGATCIVVWEIDKKEIYKEEFPYNHYMKYGEVFRNILDWIKIFI